MRLKDKLNTTTTTTITQVWLYEMQGDAEKKKNQM
jgi:hypothetical protein